jgi:hypothetical protein
MHSDKRKALMDTETLKAMTALDIIARSIAMHPTTFLESLQSRAYEDSRYAATRDSTAIKRSVMASYEATMRACEYVDSERVEAFAGDMSAGIIALNVACNLQCLPAYMRTETAVAQWGNR